jgi:RimJ/RimL family protein N-acetyltransferase
MVTRLRDGQEVLIRRIHPEDKPLLSAGHARLSSETIYRRFLAPKPRLTSADLRYLTEVDGHDHFALVATPLEHPEWIVAVGRFVRLREDPAVAEFAIVVGDHYQRQGLGTQLAQLLAQEARLRGIERFTATVLSENVAVRRLIATLSEQLEYQRAGGGVERIDAALAA